MSASPAPRCTHRRQLGLIVLSMPALFAAWTWIGVVAYQRWGNKPIDLTRPDEVAFMAIGAVIFAASLQAATRLIAKAEQVVEQHDVCQER